MTEDKKHGDKIDEKQVVIPDSSCDKPRRKRSVGEHVFDWGAYSFTGVATLVASVFPGYWARYGKGAAMAESASEALMKAGLSQAAAKDSVITTALMLGGCATLPIIKTLEDHKIPIINAINDKAGCESDPEAIKKQPKQTWTSLIKSRVVAWSTVFTSFRGTAMLIGEQKFDKFEKDFAEKMLCRPFGKPTHINGQETKLFKYGRIAALDIFATVASTVLLYIGTRIFAKQGAPEQESCDEPKPALMAASSAKLEQAAKEKSFTERLNQEPEQGLGAAR